MKNKAVKVQSLSFPLMQTAIILFIKEVNIIDLKKNTNAFYVFYTPPKTFWCDVSIVFFLLLFSFFSARNSEQDTQTPRFLPLHQDSCNTRQ